MSELYIEGGQSGPLYNEGRDLVSLDGQRMPGFARIRGARVSYRSDPKQARGKSAARPTYAGLDTASTFTIEWKLWTPEQRDAAKRLLLEWSPNRIFATSGTIPPRPISSVQIDHLDLTHVVIEGATCFEWDGTYDTCTLTVRAWYPSEKTRARTTSPKTSTTPERPRNLVTEGRNAATNPRPTAQSGVCGPRQPA